MTRDQAFNVGEEVLAVVDGFDPFPAVVESVLLSETDNAVYYYVRLRGATEIVPLGSGNLVALDQIKYRPKKYSDKELKKESKMRVEALLGADDEVPEILMNFVTVDSDFEEVSEETVKRLGLHAITLDPSMVNSFDAKLLGSKSANTPQEDDIVDVEGVQPDDEPLNSRLIRNARKFLCAICNKRFRTVSDLKRHKQLSLLCINKNGLRKANQPKRLKKSNSSKERKDKCDSSSDVSEEPSLREKSVWANKSASGFYPCKLCFLKFRSMGEAQSHMMSHKSHHNGRKELLSRPVTPHQGSEDSLSGGDTEDSRSEKHCSMERVRRAELKAKFFELAEALSLDRGASKVRILEMAKLKINELEKEYEDQDELLTDLQVRNFDLRARYLELNQDS